MINYIRKLYNDWLTFRMIRQNLNVLDPIKNEEAIRYIVNRYSEEREEEINSLLMHALTKELIRDNISPEKYRGYIMALEHRINLFRNHRKLLNKKPN